MKQRARAQRARDAGIAQAVQSADDASAGWSARAGGMLNRFILESEPGLQFTSEDVRKFASKKGLPDPPHMRAWGGVFRAAAIRGVIEKVGTAQSRASHCHLSYVSAWRPGRMM